VRRHFDVIHVDTGACVRTEPDVCLANFLGFQRLESHAYVHGRCRNIRDKEDRLDFGVADIEGGY